MLLQLQFEVWNLDCAYRTHWGDRLKIMRLMVEAGATMTDEEEIIWWPIAKKVPRYRFLARVRKNR
jgi:hypothetical protein